jgi:hypothetical protein
MQLSALSGHFRENKKYQKQKRIELKKYSEKEKVRV